MKSISILMVTLAAAMSGAAPALADPIDDLLAQSEAFSPSVAEPGAERRKPMGDETLGEYSAGDSLTYQVQAGQLLTGTSEGNTIDGDVDTGDVVFDANALSGFSGIGNFVANTGANSNLNGSVMVNIVGAAPAP